MERVIGGVHITSNGWKTDGPVLLAVLVGVSFLVAGFWVHGWLRFGLQAVGAVLALPLVALVFLIVLGGAFGALTEPEPSLAARGALAVLAIGFGVWFGSYAPSAPQDLVITPVGVIGSVYMLRRGRARVPGARRRVAGSLALFAAAAGATGVWLLATA